MILVFHTADLAIIYLLRFPGFGGGDGDRLRLGFFFVLSGSPKFIMSSTESRSLIRRGNIMFLQAKL